MSDVLARYTNGTHRVCTPAETLARIQPLLNACGVTRCADVTRLEIDLGVPTCCAIRPGATVLATSNGKGLSDDNAKVSALMESIELFHAEVPEPERLRVASRSELDGIHPAELPHFRDGYYSDDFRLEWIEGEILGTDRRIWAAASAVYAHREPSLYQGTTNGLASGNHPVEATLHALYEVIERDAISRLEADGRLQIKGRCLVLDPTQVPDTTLRGVVDAIGNARSRLVLLWVPSVVPVHTFWALLVNLDPRASASTLNLGYGTHHDVVVAATRAVTEAVQSRLSSIHGAREDIVGKPNYAATGGVRETRAFRYFTALEPTHTWQDIPTTTAPDRDLVHVLNGLVADLDRAGHEVLRFDLTKPAISIPVVKVIAPTLRFERRLF